MGNATLSTTVQDVVPPANRNRLGVILDNQDTAIEIAVVERNGQTIADGARIAPGTRRFYKVTEDGQTKLNRAFRLVAASGNPVVAFEQIWEDA